LLNAVLTEAVNAQASDLHIETFKETLSIRFRVDGVLRHALTPPRHIAQLLVSRVKVMSQLDIAEKRVPQDGRMSVHVAGKLIDIRISTLPTNHGERIVLRLLEKQMDRLNLEHLGTSAAQTVKLKALLRAPHGILLVTGPTGSGKTTSLYAALSHLNDGSRNILTIEDPVEYDLEGIGQSQVNHKIDMNFARGLRAILRQDPDVVMVGEIRDKETAEIAIQASMTGHLVLSTLHTNTAIGAIARLLDIGIEPFLLSSSLLGVVAQRLVRVLCVECKEPYTPESGEVAALTRDTLGDIQFYHAPGCDACHQTGYRGRTAVYEIITADAEFRRQIYSGASEAELTKSAHERSRSLQQDSLDKVLSGITSVEEVLRVTTANPTDE
jgi:general secretion pathway protein E